jgi:hypothetical protein
MLAMRISLTTIAKIVGWSKKRTLRAMNKLIGMDGAHRHPERLTLEPRQPWLRGEKESSKAFRAFQMYCEMGAERTPTEVAKRLNVRKQCTR